VLLLFFLHKNGTFDAISQTSVSPPKLETWFCWPTQKF
jgi:hypothetical protein